MKTQKTQKAVITQDVVTRALDTYNGHASLISQSCVVYQMCKDLGMPVEYCGISEIILEDKSAVTLPESAVAITRLNYLQWPSVVGREIELPVLA